MRIHAWGAEFSARSVVWWDVWARTPCWQVVQAGGPAYVTVTFTLDEAVALRDTADFALGMVGPQDLADDLFGALVKLAVKIPARRERASRRGNR